MLTAQAIHVLHLILGAIGWVQFAIIAMLGWIAYRQGALRDGLASCILLGTLSSPVMLVIASTGSLSLRLAAILMATALVVSLIPLYAQILLSRQRSTRSADAS